MSNLLDFIQSHLPDSWFDNFHKAWGDSLSDETVMQSVQEASDFFNMNAPMDVHEDFTTGVMTGMNFTEDDDILIFNRRQMQDMGISDKEGFDLIMTHEAAHRALQGINMNLSSHQEELCCDYLSGVRAGMNHMDWSKMANSLIDTFESESHPEGVARVHAMADGVAFAHHWMNSHNGNPPTFSDCLEHFEQSEVFNAAHDCASHADEVKGVSDRRMCGYSMGCTCPGFEPKTDGKEWEKSICRHCGHPRSYHRFY